jgi:hypothetical protein
MTMRFTSRHVAWLIVLLGVLTIASTIWPVYRSFLIVDININEAWNAYFADAAFHGTKLYPSRDQFITNNYPPLSFYVVGAAGALIGDTILAGRLLSLFAIVAISLIVGLIIRQLGGNRTAAWVGGLYFASAMFRFSPGYAGMNDPQLLAQAVMAFGFLGFLKAIKRDRGYLWPLLVMLLAGFLKHNIIAMPVVAFAWLALHRPRRFIPCSAIALAAMILGFAFCHVAYGPDFWMNMRAPRTYHLYTVLEGLAQLQWIAVGLVAWLYVGIALRAVPAVKLCNLWIAVSFAVFLLQKAGEGVADNAMFDLTIAVSVAVGVAFAKAAEVPLVSRYSPERLRVGLLIAICIRVIASSGNEAVSLFFDSDFREEIALREAAMRESIAAVRATPGDVYSAAIVCYRAGKPFIVDHFNFQQRVKAGQLPQDALEARIAAGTLTRVQVKPRIAWANPLED